MEGATGVPVYVGAVDGAGPGGFGGQGGTETITPVIDFEPVTTEELSNPDPGDWLMYRRTLDGQGYSPLGQIDRRNVHELRLAWVWSMDEGVNQPTPLVHDGVMYLTNPMNTIQALDAATGELMWEYRRQFPEDFRAGFSQLRSIAIYDDKIYVPTKDAWMVALDARTGEIGDQWDQRVHALPRGLLLHHRARRSDGRGALAHVYHRAAGRARRRHLGRPAFRAERWRRRLDHR
jgi:alcohol dehydrogenase (cytochrome c)